MAARTSGEELIRKGEMDSLRTHRQNLLQVCGLAVKAIVDKACTDVIDDDSPELYHLCTALEHVMLLGYKGDQGTSVILQQISLETLGMVVTPRDYWSYITAVLGDTNAVQTVERMDGIVTALGKCRAWLFISLVQKSAGQFFSRLLNDNELSRKSYANYSVVRSEEGQFLAGLLEALTSVDFALCLKGNTHLNVPYSPAVDYFHFVRPLLENGRTIQSSNPLANQQQSDTGDERSAVMEHDDTMVISLPEFSTLQKRLDRERQQKTYLEELLKSRDHQLALLTHEKEALHNKMDAVAAEAQHEREELQAIVLELHDKICQQESQLRSVREQLSSNHPSADLDETDQGRERDVSNAYTVGKSPQPKSFFQKLFGRSKKNEPRSSPQASRYNLSNVDSELVVNGDDKVSSDTSEDSDIETSNELRGSGMAATNTHHSVAEQEDEQQHLTERSPSVARKEYEQESSSEETG